MSAGPLLSTPEARAADAVHRRRALAELPLFQGLSDAELEEVAAWSTTRSLASGRCVYRRGEPSQGLYLVLDGELEVVRLEDDSHERALATLGRGEVFGEAAFLDDRPHGAEVRAVETARVVVLPRELLQSFFDQHPSRRLRLRTLAVTRRLAKVSNAFAH